MLPDQRGLDFYWLEFLAVLWLAACIAAVVSLVGALWFAWSWWRFVGLSAVSVIGRPVVLALLRFEARRRGGL